MLGREKINEIQSHIENNDHELLIMEQPYEKNKIHLESERNRLRDTFYSVAALGSILKNSKESSTKLQAEFSELTKSMEDLQNDIRNRQLDLDQLSVAILTKKEVIGGLRLNLRGMPTKLSDLEEYKPIQEDSLFISLLASFNESINSIHCSAHLSLKKVKSVGLEMADNILSKHTSARKKNIGFDYKYYRDLINLAIQLLNNPEDIHSQQKYRLHASHHPSETPTIWFKINGIALMFLGAVIAAGAALVGIFGFPFGAPLYISIPVGVAGIGIIAAGIGLFCRGSNKGLPGLLQEFAVETDTQKAAVSRTIDL